jgi:hypothetical protein
MLEVLQCVFQPSICGSHWVAATSVSLGEEGIVTFALLAILFLKDFYFRTLRHMYFSSDKLFFFFFFFTGTGIL